VSRDLAAKALQSKARAAFPCGHNPLLFAVQPWFMGRGDDHLEP
jgi:hypothetical protein